MKSIDQRPIEIRNLFNPAFCGLVLARAMLEYQIEDEESIPFSLTLLILPLSLQKRSREILSRGKRSYFLKVVAAHPELLIGFDRRVQDMLPYTMEALGFLMSLGVFSVSKEGRLGINPDKIQKTIKGTEETKECQRVAKYLGKHFAKIGDRATVYTTMGVRP